MSEVIPGGLVKGVTVIGVADSNGKATAPTAIPVESTPAEITSRTIDGDDRVTEEVELLPDGTVRTWTYTYVGDSPIADTETFVDA